MLNQKAFSDWINISINRKTAFKEHHIILPREEKRSGLLASVSLLGMMRNTIKGPTPKTCYISLYQKRRNGVIRGKVSGCSTEFFYCPKLNCYEILTICTLVCCDILVRSHCMILRCPNPRFLRCCNVGKWSEIFTWNYTLDFISCFTFWYGTPMNF